MKITVNSQDLGYAGDIGTYQNFDGYGVDEMIIEGYNQEHGTDYDYDDFEWDYEHAEIVKDLATERAKLLQDDVDIIKSVKVIKTGSPREYNYSTDWADFEIDYDSEAVDAYIYQHPEEWSDFYRRNWYSAIEWRDDGEVKDEMLQVARLHFYLHHFWKDNWEDYDPLRDYESDIYWEHTRCTKDGEQVN